jgi:hypothetical protein
MWAGMRQMTVLRGLMAKFGQNESLKAIPHNSQNKN